VIDLNEFFAGGPPLPRWLGQTSEAFQTALQEWHRDVIEGDCDFYHTTEFPDGRTIAAEWDLRGQERAYTGGIDVAGKRLIEFGPASGWMTKYFAEQGAQTTIFDLPPGHGWEVVPFAGVDIEGHRQQAIATCTRLRNSWWFARQQLGFAATAVYGDIYDPPSDLGDFDIAFFGALLLHLSNPFRALQAAAAITRQTIAVTDMLFDSDAIESNGVPAVVFCTTPPPHGLVHWWSITPGAIQRMLAVLGFGRAEITIHAPATLGGPRPMFTVVAHRTIARAGRPTTVPVEAPPQVVEAAAPLGQGDGLPIPPPALRLKVAGTDDLGVFLRLGRQGYESLVEALGDAGTAPERVGSVLDFGCGVGRVLRYWPASDLEVHGTDYFPEAIDWCRKNLEFAEFGINTLEGPLDYPDGHFGFVYALSVFTHLPERLQRRWFRELTRILRPGGLLYFTTHGDHYRDRLPPMQRADYMRGYLAVVGDEQPGTNLCGAFHPPAYVRREVVVASGLELVQFKPCGARGNPEQDSYIVRKPGGSL
jgi:O-methyltransferase